MKFAVTILMVAASLISFAVPARADCGDPGQPACEGPVPTVDQVVSVMAELTDPNIPAANKGNIVTPGFTPDEAQTVDDHLQRMNNGTLPLNFIVTDIQPAPGNLAGATVATTGPGGIHSWSQPGSIVLANVGGHWELTHQSAMSALDAYWYNAHRSVVVPHI